MKEFQSCRTYNVIVWEMLVMKARLLSVEVILMLLAAIATSEFLPVDYVSRAEQHADSMAELEAYDSLNHIRPPPLQGCCG